MEFKGTKVFNVEYHATGVLPYKYVVSDIQETDEEAKANAQLIANAAKMLEMLQLAVIELESGPKGHWEITGMIKELIEQATKID